MDLAISFLSQYGLFIIPLLLLAGAVGFPFPEDLITLATGYLVYREVFAFGTALTVLGLSIFAADLLMFAAGRFLGDRLLKEDKRNKMAARLERWGTGLIFVSRFVFGTRGIVFLASGALGVPLLKFAFADLLAGIIFVPALFMLAVHSGSRIEHIAGIVEKSSGIVGGVLLVVVVGAAVFWLFQRKKERNRS